MRLNTHEEEVLGQTTPDGSAPYKMTTTDGASGGSKPASGCPRFGEHPADRHRESEIYGGAFHGA